MELTKNVFIETCKRYSEYDPSKPDNAVVVTLLSKPGRKRHVIGLFNIEDGFFVYHDYNRIEAGHYALDLAREAMIRANRFGSATSSMRYNGETYEYELAFTQFVKQQYLNETMLVREYTRIDQAIKRFLGLPHELIVDKKSSAEIYLVVTMDSENKMSKEGSQLAFTPDTASFLKAATLGHALILSQKAWDTLPDKYKPVPLRTTYVLSRDPSFKAPGATVCGDLDTALKTVRQNKVFVVGGHQLLEEAFPSATGAIVARFHEPVGGEHAAPLFTEERFNKRVMHIGMHMGVNYSLLKYKKK